MRELELCFIDASGKLMYVYQHLQILLLVAYAIHAADGRIEYKHQVMPEILGRDALPMDGDEVRYLLRHDT